MFFNAFTDFFDIDFMMFFWRCFFVLFRSLGGFGPKTVRRIVRGITLGASKIDPGAQHDVWMHFGDPLAPFWLTLVPFGSLSVPFWLPLAPFWLPFAPSRLHVASFSSLRLPFGTSLHPFYSFWTLRLQSFFQNHVFWAPESANHLQMVVCTPTARELPLAPLLSQGLGAELCRWQLGSAPGPKAPRGVFDLD